MPTVIRGTDSSASAPALTGADSDTGVYFPAANQVALATNGTQALIVDSSQNVGIGTSSPGQKLEVSNSSTNTTFSTVGNQLLIRNSGSTVNAFSRIDFAGGASNNPTASIAATISNYGTGATDLLFGTFNTGGGVIAERARIDSSGNLLVGTTATTPNPGIGLFPAGNITVGNSAGGSGFEFHTFRRSGTQIGSITQNGTTAVAYNTSSDYRLKYNIEPMTGALAKVAALKPCVYKWNADDSAGEGFIAHELAEVCPSAVTGEKDAVDSDGNPKYQGIDTSFLVATLTAAIQEQQAIITALTTRVEALEAAQP